ncbi:MAG: class I SAM-dependent methyltransferase [Candidatus Lokiarchaeota archaeon]|nr:class I SAM-dependent methyltransferase [Candidatus Lokiarchaeota archaeon]
MGEYNIRKIELFSENGNSRGFYDVANQLNDLTGKEWVFSTKSVIPKGYPPSFQLKLRNKHGGQKPPELCESLIQTFTKEGDSVLDPFCGVGGTLFGCSLSNRIGVGIELNKDWIDIYNTICDLESIKPQEMIHGDSREILKKFINEKRSFFDFILTDIPYWKMDVVEKSKGTYKKVGEESKGIYSEKSKLSRFSRESKHIEVGKNDWEDLISDVFRECFSLLKPGSYCAVFIGNMYYKGKYYLLNADVARILIQIGFILKGEIIWYDVNKKLHLYGINYSWIPSIVHQFIMIFRKERISNLNKEEKEIIQTNNLKRIKDKAFYKE